jgi:hypothetical protein
MSKFGCFFFDNPTNKTVTGTAYMWGLLITNHLNQSLWWTNQKYWAAVRSNFLHSFLEVHNSVVPFTSHGKLHEFGAQKPISWGTPAPFVFFAINFTVLSHILSIVGDALRTCKLLHIHILQPHMNIMQIHMKNLPYTNGACRVIMVDVLLHDSKFGLAPGNHLTEHNGLYPSCSIIQTSTSLEIDNQE